jgi:hypothetical protein
VGVRVAPYVPAVRWACAHFSQAAEASVVRCSVYGRVWALRRMGFFFRRLTSYPLANFFGAPFIFGSRLFAGVLGPPKIPAGAAVSQSRFKIKLKTSTSSGG